MNETPDSKYKDDADDFALSSDLATRGSTGEYAGGGPGTSSANHVPAKGDQAWQSGANTRSTDEHAVESRSDDPGQSSYGGFKGEGPATPEGDPKP